MPLYRVTISNKKLVIQDYLKKSTWRQTLTLFLLHITDGSSRVSKSGRHTDARLRNIFHKLRKILHFECETVKITSFNLILLILTHFFCVLCSFRHIFMHKYFLAGHFVCATHIAFRKCGLRQPCSRYVLSTVTRGCLSLHCWGFFFTWEFLLILLKIYLSIFVIASIV